MNTPRPRLRGACTAMGLAMLCAALSSCTRECDCQTQEQPPELERHAGIVAMRADVPEISSQMSLSAEVESTPVLASVAIDPGAQPQAVPAPEEEVTNGRGKIVGGEDAPPGSYPWIVALGFRTEGGGPVRVRCGGTLVRHDWVVSAAHCKLRKDYIAIAGRHDLTQRGGLEIPIAEVHIHPNYDPETKKESDLVLLRLERSAGVEPITMVAANAEDPGPVEPLHVAGWGKLSEDNPNTPDILQHVMVKMSDHAVCKRNYARVYRTVSDTMLCAAEEGKDACSGDSGGPLVRVDPYTGRSTLTGVVSWGLDNKCARQGYPGVYVKLARFRTWIDECIADTSRAACG